MSGRQIFSESEKLCLQELIIKYKINSASTLAAGNSAAKKVAWASLVEEYNSIEHNSKRTESQLKKCWDNLKSRKKALLALEKRKRMQTGGGSYHPTTEPSKDGTMLIDEALLPTTDVEIQYVIDSDNLPLQITTDEGMQDTVATEETEPETVKDNLGRSASRHTDYSASGQQTPGGAKNIRAKVLSDEFQIRKNNYQRMQEREEELHILIMAEKQWLVKAAEEKFKKLEMERRNAEEILRYNQLKREEAEKQINKK